MFYLGLDPSLTSFGVVLIDEKNTIIVKKVLRTTNQRPMEHRIVQLTNGVFDLFSKIVPDPKHYLRIAIEGLSYGSKGQAVAELGALHYFLRIMFADNELRYEVIPPTTVKKFVTGTGRAKKEQMLLAAYKKYQVSFDSTDLCDAYSLARFIAQYPTVDSFIESTKPKKSKAKPKPKDNKPKPEDSKDGDKK